MTRNTGLASQSREPGRALGNTRRHIGRRVEFPRFLPQPSRFFHLSRSLFEDRKWPNGVCEIERGSSLVAPIERERLLVTAVG